MRLMTIRADHMSEDQARAADDRDGLAAEAQLRAEKAAAGENEKKSGARLGAPEPEEEASASDESAADSDASDDDDGDSADED